MYRGMTVAVVVPAYEEALQIPKVVKTMPGFVDHILIVDDCSKDQTPQVVAELAKSDTRVVYLRHDINQGVGGAIATGYEWCRDHEMDCAAVMAGDGQMDPADLPNLLDPVVDDFCDYSKGNRLVTGRAWQTIPRVRYLGNAALSLLTKIASGYWCIADSQSGYTVVNKEILRSIDWQKMYKRYGQPNDLLVKLNIEDFRVHDVPIRPVYNVGEVSKMRIAKVIFTISALLFVMFWNRIFNKYVIRDFHPLVFFYTFSFILVLLDIPLAIRLFGYMVSTGIVLPVNLLIVMFLTISAFMTGFIAMYMDMQYNQHLNSAAWRRHGGGEARAKTFDQAPS